MAEILNGGVKISNNPKLCNMDNVLWNDIIDTSKKPLTVLEFASNLSSCEYWLTKMLCTPPFQREEWTSHLSCSGFQVHQFLHACPPSPVPRKGIHFFTTGLRHNFSWWLGPWLIGQRSSLESFSWFQTVPYVCVSSKTAQNNVHSFVFQQSSVYNVRLWSRRPIWVPSWSYCGTWSPFSAKAKVECRKTPVFWAARIILAKLMINSQIDLML